jgi:hypothetical protein
LSKIREEEQTQSLPSNQRAPSPPQGRSSQITRPYLSVRSTQNIEKNFSSIAAALEIYKKTNGRLPQTLQQLVDCGILAPEFVTQGKYKFLPEAFDGHSPYYICLVDEEPYDGQISVLTIGRFVEKLDPSVVQQRLSKQRQVRPGQ